MPASIEDAFWDAAIVHAVDMTQPEQSALPKESVHTGEANTRQDLGVGHSGCPGYAQDMTNTFKVKGIESFLMSSIRS